MKYQYDREPKVKVTGYDDQAWEGKESVIHELKRVLGHQETRQIITIDCYPGVDEPQLIEWLQDELTPVLTLHANDTYDNEADIEARLYRHVTDDRVFGLMSHHRIEEFMDEAKLDEAKRQIDAISMGIVLIYGFGATLIHPGDIALYADMARWEIQTRMKEDNMSNHFANNSREESLRKFKRGYFVEWRMADRHKRAILKNMDYLLDTNQKTTPKMITMKALYAGIDQTVSQPFRVVPYFEPGPWGGQWMKKVCNLEADKANYAWCFDCVPEENSLYLQYGKVRIEIPSIDVVFERPRQLLGEQVHARFGHEFPIRFDLLDTMEGGNLSLQVHPLTEYIQETFGMHYTQDESYYLLDAAEDAVVYLGLEDKIQKEDLLEALEKANRQEESFEAEDFVAKWPAKKHDHFLIPAGTIHCSGANSMVLEISATPYIFTFKLWDWNRLGMDNKPRPIHLDHGKANICWDRDRTWVEQQLINQSQVIHEEDGIVEERTGLHEREFIETRRHWFSQPVVHHTNGGVQVLTLIEGEEAIVESPTSTFEPFVVHYGETFIIPAHLGEYRIRPYGRSLGKTIGTIKAYVRT